MLAICWRIHGWVKSLATSVMARASSELERGCEPYHWRLDSSRELLYVREPVDQGSHYKVLECFISIKTVG